MNRILENIEDAPSAITVEDIEILRDLWRRGIIHELYRGEEEAPAAYKVPLGLIATTDGVSEEVQRAAKAAKDAAGLEEGERPIESRREIARRDFLRGALGVAGVAAAIQRYWGLFKEDGTLADNADIPNLNIDQGKRETIEIDLAELEDLNDGTLSSLRRLFEENEASEADIALVAPEVVGQAPEEWNELFLEYGLPGILMTPATLEQFNRIQEDRQRLAILLAALHDAGGLIL